MKYMNSVSRRDLLKNAGLTLLSASLLDSLFSVEAIEAEESYGFLVDVGRCIGCGNCQVACKVKNDLPTTSNLPYEKKQRSPWDNYSSLSAYTWTRIRGQETSRGWRFIKEQCMHCIDPACASVCFVGALHKTREGPVIYDRDRCVGCRYCVMACPWGVPKWQWDEPFPFIQKCDMCYDWVIRGVEPACVQACEVDALFFGKRIELLKEAKKRIAEGGYVDYIYGEKEAGGTCILYISDVPFEELRFKEVLKSKYPELTEAYLSKMPLTITGMLLGLTGLYLFVGRRRKKE